MLKVVTYRATWRTFRPQTQNFSLKKFLIFSRKKFFLYFGKWNFLTLRLEKILNFTAQALKIFP